MALFNDGAEGNVCAFKRNRCYRSFAAVTFKIPTGDGFVALHGERDVIKCDLGTSHALFGRNNTTGSSVLEVNVVHVFKLGVEIYSAVFLNGLRIFAKTIEQSIIFGVPAGQPLAVLNSYFWLQQSIAGFDDLRVIGFRFFLISKIELIGDILVSIRPDDSHDCRTCRQYVERQ